MPMAKMRDALPQGSAQPNTAAFSADMMPVSDSDWQALQHEVARYIGSMSAEMATMARSAKLDLLVYFLDMAQVEATAQAERTDR